MNGSIMSQDKAKNILGTDLQHCCIESMTGFFRDGYCNTNHMDQGTHVVCACGNVRVFKVHQIM